MFETKKHDRTSEELNETALIKQDWIEFKWVPIKMLTILEIRVEELTENLHKEIDNIKQNQLALNNTKNEMKNTPVESTADQRMKKNLHSSWTAERKKNKKKWREV